MSTATWVCLVSVLISACDENSYRDPRQSERLEHYLRLTAPLLDMLLQRCTISDRDTVVHDNALDAQWKLACNSPPPVWSDLCLSPKLSGATWMHCTGLFRSSVTVP
jgi:hypothetical protein